jgi:hypothetical protein
MKLPTPEQIRGDAPVESAPSITLTPRVWIALGQLIDEIPSWPDVEPKHVRLTFNPETGDLAMEFSSNAVTHVRTDGRAGGDTNQAIGGFPQADVAMPSWEPLGSINTNGDITR